MCIVNDLTVQNCKTHSIHSIFHHESLETDNPSLLDRIKNSFELRKDKIVFSEIKENKLKEYKGKDVLKMVENLACFIKALTNQKKCSNLEEDVAKHNKDTPIAIYLDTSLPYMIADLALQSLEIKSLSIYSTHGQDAVKKIIKDENVKIAFSEKVIDVDIVILCNQNGKKVEKENTSGPKIFYFEEIVKKMHSKFEEDQENRVQDQNQKSPSIYENFLSKVQYSQLKLPITQIYTSGTTSFPKPHVITVGNALSLIDSFFRGIEWHVFENIKFLLGDDFEYLESESTSEKIDRIIMNNQNVHLSYLPLSHIMERLLSYLFLCVGVKIVYYGGDKKSLLKDFKLSSANFLVGAPKVFETIGQKFETTFFKKVLKIKKWCCESNKVDRPKKKPNKIAQIGQFFLTLFKFFVLKLLQICIFNRIKSRHNFRFLFSGGAHIRTELKEIISEFFGVPFYEAYGMSETCGVISVNNHLKNEDGLDKSVGWPIFPVEWKLNNGELLVRGPNVKEFDENKEEDFLDDGEIKSAEIFERNRKSGKINWDCSIVRENHSNEQIQESHVKSRTIEKVDSKQQQDCYPAPQNTGPWYRTGDLAKIENGLLHITGRIKNNFKLSQGEFIVPERIENLIGVDGIQCTVLGKSKWKHLVGIVHLKPCKCGNDDKNETQEVLTISNSTDSLTSPCQLTNVDNPNVLTCQKCLKKQKRKLSKRIQEIRAKRLLFGFEIPQKFIFINKPIIEIDGCFTKTTFKLMRNGVWNVFEDAIAKLNQN